MGTTLWTESSFEIYDCEWENNRLVFLKMWVDNKVMTPGIHSFRLPKGHASSFDCTALGMTLEEMLTSENHAERIVGKKLFERLSIR